MWIKHDGKGCPFEPGCVVEVQQRDNLAYRVRINDASRSPRPIVNGRMRFNAWFWLTDPGGDSRQDVVRYKLISVPSEDLYQTARAPRSVCIDRMVGRYASNTRR